MPDAKGAPRATPPEEMEWGYFIVNADAPPEVPRTLKPINPKFQAKAESILLALREQGLNEDR
jgi:hypothetical protein